MAIGAVMAWTRKPVRPGPRISAVDSETASLLCPLQEVFATDESRQVGDVRCIEQEAKQSRASDDKVPLPHAQLTKNCGKRYAQQDPRPQQIGRDHDWPAAKAVHPNAGRQPSRKYGHRSDRGQDPHLHRVALSTSRAANGMPSRVMREPSSETAWPPHSLRKSESFHRPLRRRRRVSEIWVTVCYLCTKAARRRDRHAAGRADGDPRPAGLIGGPRGPAPKAVRRSSMRGCGQGQVPIRGTRTRAVRPRRTRPSRA